MKEATKSSVITLSSYMAAVVTFLSLMNMDVLASWNKFILLGIPLPYFLSVLLVGGGVGVILSEIALGIRQPKAFLKDTQKLAEEIMGIDEKQFQRTIKKGAQKLGVPSSLTDRLLTVNAASGTVEYPSPAELQSRLRADFRARVFAANAAVMTAPAGSVQSSLAIVPVEGTAATPDGLEKVSDYLKARVKRAVIILVIFGIIFVISLLVKWLV